MKMNVLSTLKKSTTGRATDSDRQEVTLDLKGKQKVFRVEMVALSSIVPDPDQPRKMFDMEKLNELADDLDKRGFLQPPGVREIENGKYMIVFGERRYRAAGILNLDQVPVVVLSSKDASEILEAQLVENTKRQDFELLELVDGFSRLVKLVGGVGQAAIRMSITPTLASQYLAIAKANAEIRSLVDERVTTDIRTLYDLTVLENKNPEMFRQTVDRLTSGEGQVSDVRKIVREAKSNDKPKVGKGKAKAKEPASKSQIMRPSEVRLTAHPIQEDSYLLKMTVAGTEQTFLLNISQATDLEKQLRQII